MFCHRRTGRAAVLVAAWLAVMGAPAAAHPYGPPPTAQLSAAGSTVTVEWRAAADDAAVVGVAVGLLDPSVVESYLEGPVQAAPPEADEIALARSDELRAYLLEHIAVSQGGTDCHGTVEETANFVTAGARIAFDCPQPIEAVEVRISMLHDVHPAYRTFADSPQETAPAQAVFTAADPTQSWDFTQGVGRGAGRGAGTGALQRALVISGLGALATVAVAAARWGQRRGGQQRGSQQ